MKFHNFCLPHREAPPSPPPPPPAFPTPLNDTLLKDLIKKLEPPKPSVLKSNLLRMAHTPAPDRRERDVSDILEILKSLNKK